MFKFIKGLFVNEPEAPAPENLVLFTPNDGSWDAKQVRRLFDAGLGRLHVQVRKDWDRRHYEQFLRAVPEVFWPRIVLGEEPELVEANKLGGFQMHPGERIPRRWPKHATVSAKCHDYDELRSTDKACGYVFLTPIFESVSKKDHRPRRTLREYEVILQRWKAEGGAPVHALGGITPKNAHASGAGPRRARRRRALDPAPREAPFGRRLGRRSRRHRRTLPRLRRDVRRQRLAAGRAPGRGRRCPSRRRRRHAR
ncbi:MAG: thiamine phosphate synthase, partial [Verrucomicrobia bacterium]|nr:thiamine phosphate synthase [Verrucomicrobiota bacterium]